MELAPKSDDEKEKADSRYQAEVHRATNAALGLARAHPLTPLAGAALRFAILTARGGGSEVRTSAVQALEILWRDHVREPKMGEFCGQIVGVYERLPIAESLIRAVLEQNPDRHERGAACHALTTLLGYQAFTVRLLQTKADELKRYRPLFEGYLKAWEDNFGKEATARFLRKDPDALDAEAEALLERIVSEFGTVTLPFDKDQRLLADVASGELFARRNLAIGKVAPEIEGQDHEGTTFKLSDYRGKVVLLTFSGNWCGPCRSMYPGERDLVKRLKQKPFALLSINTDEDQETLRKSIESGEITWRCWRDGGTGGPITTRWGVMHFPTIYLLDGDGVVRRTLYRGDSLDNAIEDLLEESEAIPAAKPKS